jgi:hypothetical protein
VGKLETQFHRQGCSGEYTPYTHCFTSVFSAYPALYSKDWRILSALEVITFFKLHIVVEEKQDKVIIVD